MTSANPLLSNDERKILLSLIDRIESECCANNESASSSDSSPSRSSTETISVSHNCRRNHRSASSRVDSCAFCLPDSCQPALHAHNDESRMTTNTYGSALLSAPDMLSYDSNLQSIVASVSTVQATDTAGLKPREAKPKKPVPSLICENYVSSINEGVDELPTKRRTARAKRRRVRAANDSQAAWKRELFSQFLCSGLSEEDQRENLLCLLRAAKNRSFCIRGDQRKKFIDLQLAAKRREAPVRVNRTTQLRMQQVDDARQWEQNQANWVNRYLSTGHQRQQQLKRRRQLKKQREEQEEQNCWQPVQRNRNAALTDHTHSLSTVTSPSPSLNKEETVRRRRRRRKNKSADSSDTDISLTSLTVALDDIRAQSSVNQRQRRQKKDQSELLPKKAAAQKPQTPVAVRATASGTSTATTLTATGSTNTTTNTTTSSTTVTTSNTSTLLEDVNEVGDSLSISTCQPPAFKADKKIEKSLLHASGSEAKGKNLDTFREEVNKKISSLSTNASDQNTPPTPKPRLHRRGIKQDKKTPDFDVLQRRMAQRQRETNNLGETGPLTTSPVSAESLEKLRENFLQGVDKRLFGSAGGSSSKSIASGDSIAAGSSNDSSIGGQLYSEFSHLRTDLGELLESKKRTLKADLSPTTQTELLSENQQRLSAKVRQLDSLIQRVRAHLDTHSKSNTSREVLQRKAVGETLSAVEHHDEAEIVAEVLGDGKQKFAQMIGLDMSTNAASEISSIYRTESSEHKKCLKLIESHGEEPVPKSWSKACRHENVVSFKCTSPLYNQTMSSDTAINIRASASCQHDQQLKGQDAKEQPEEVYDSEDFNDCERQALSLKPSEKDAHAARIVNQMRQQLNIMRNAGGRIKSLGDPLATLDRCRRASRQRAIERDPSEARLVPVILRYRKWPPGSGQFLAFQSNRCNWCKRYREAVLPLWTKTIRVDLSLHEPIMQSLLLLTVRLGKPLSPDWVLSTNAFPDDSCPGKAAIIDLLKTPQQAGLKPWQTVFISETNMTSRLAEEAELAQVKIRAAKRIAASRLVAVDDDSPPVELSDIGTMMASAECMSPTSLDAGTVTVCAKQAVLVSERVAATEAAGSLSISGEEKKLEEPSYCSTCKFSSAAKVNTYGNVKAGKGGSGGVRVSGDISNEDYPSAPQTLSSLNTSSIAGDCDSGQRAHLESNYAAKNMRGSNHDRHAALPCVCPTMINSGIYSMNKVPEDSEPSGCTASLQSSVR